MAHDLMIAMLFVSTTAFVTNLPVPSRRCLSHAMRGYPLEDALWDEVAEDLEFPRRMVDKAHGLHVDPAVVISLALVSILLLSTMVVTVPDDSKGVPRFDIALPKLSEWIEVPGGQGGVYQFSSDESFSIAPVSTIAQLLEATLFQWRVFTLETRYPTGFYGGADENPVIELLRAVVNFFGTGLKNRARYEARCAEECEIGADRALDSLPAPDCCDPDNFVDGFGLSIGARNRDGSLVGISSVRVRLVPFDGRDYFFAYVTGIAVAASARRQGLASGLLDFCARKAKAWGADGIALHVNKINTPALNFYARRNFEIIPDFFGYNPTRFLLYADFRARPRFLDVPLPTPSTIVSTSSDSDGDLLTDDAERLTRTTELLSAAATPREKDLFQKTAQRNS